MGRIMHHFSQLTSPMTPNKKVSLLIFSLFLIIHSAILNAKSSVPDFVSLSEAERKNAFINTLLPMICQQNKVILAQRHQLNLLSKKDKLTPVNQLWLEKIGRIYGITFTESIPPTQWFTHALHRVDIIPPSLALAQAANESGWGTSRFARIGNNYFGIWCYTPGCGMVPLQRNPGEIHEVQTFSSLQASVSAYFRNINTNPAYIKLRDIRENNRKQGLPLDSLSLIQGLSNYSERGQSYVSSLSVWIQQSKLQKYDAYCPDLASFHFQHSEPQQTN